MKACMKKQCAYWAENKVEICGVCDGKRNFKIPFKLTNYQSLARRTMQKFKKIKLLEDAAFGLNGESGEVADIMKKHLFQGHHLDENHLIEELGDVLWYIAEAAEALGTTVEHIAELNIDKLKARYPEGFSEEQSINRKI